MAFKDILPWIGGGVPGGLFGTKGGRNFLYGKNPKLKQISNFSPEQQKLFQEMMGALQGSYGNATGVLNQYLDTNSDAYKTLEAPYRREFEEQTIPMLAERFAGAGANSGALSSSAFGQSLGAAGAGLQERLASMKAQKQMEAAQGIFNQFGGALNQQPFSYYENPGSQGQGANLLAMFLKAFGGGF